MRRCRLPGRMREDGMLAAALFSGCAPIVACALLNKPAATAQLDCLPLTASPLFFSSAGHGQHGGRDPAHVADGGRPARHQVGWVGVSNSRASVCGPASAAQQRCGSSPRVVRELHSSAAAQPRTLLPRSPRSLALSLHAPTQELRQTIVPSAKAFKLDRCCLCCIMGGGQQAGAAACCAGSSSMNDATCHLAAPTPPRPAPAPSPARPRRLMAAVDEYQRRTARSVFVEYVMLGPGERQHGVLCTAWGGCMA